MNKAFEYSIDVVNKKKIAPKYVIKQCKEVVKIFEGKDKNYVVDVKKLEIIENLTKLMIMPKGRKAGQTIFESLIGYQWLVIIASFCIVLRNNPKRRRYTKVILEIPRKNYKTYTVAVIMIICFILEPQMATFFSVAPDGTLSRLIRNAIEEILRSSPLLYLYNDTPRFDIRRDYISFSLNRNKYTPLNYSNSRLDGREPYVFAVDEVGALPTNYAIEAMQSGQLNVENPLGFIISTKYPTVKNPMEDEIIYAKKVLDGIFEDDQLFALLYEPNNPKKWMSDDKVLLETNPAAQTDEIFLNDLYKKRNKAIEEESTRENFLTKHCNIIYQGIGTENYISIDKLQECKVNHIDWKGREVFLGVDLSMTNDNTSVIMIAEDDGTILFHAMIFIPEGRIEEKSKFEKVDYKRFVQTKKCIACGDLIIDYSVVEDYVFHIEKEFGVTVSAIGYDKYNCISSSQKWQNGKEIDGKLVSFTTVEVKQHSSVLHPATKFLKEKIYEKKFAYEENQLIEENFANCKVAYDTNMKMYLNKKHSNGKVDIVAGGLNAIYLLLQEIIYRDDFIVQSIRR